MTTATIDDIAAWYDARRDESLGHGEWHEVSLEDVRGFAAVTRDDQWIHTDPERAADGPYGGPIAHGFLVLSLVPHLCDSLLDFRWSAMAVNYRIDKVRFRAPVPVGAKVRASAKVHQCRVRPRGYLELALAVTVELADSTAPACSLVFTTLHQVRDDASLPVALGASAPATPSSRSSAPAGADGTERNAEVN
ncbi:MaoC family dehydratase [Saccharomonospora sp. NB11]|jgi:acyl dehydratase|uniref:MaoC family dehydratase n=1 Tax=Saccharomonospora sp. NB11 TaxID=1642298 RepID=UPI0018D0CF60|nr:MaoC family dehydratase [Saccharomonospora sp. NB11]